MLAIAAILACPVAGSVWAQVGVDQASAGVEAGEITDSPALNAFWREQAALADAQMDPAAAADRRGAIEGFVRQLAERAPARIDPTPEGHAWAEAILGELRRRRERVFAALASDWRGLLIDPADPGVSRRASLAVGDIAFEAERFSRLVGDMLLIERGLDQARSLDEDIGGGRSIRGILDAWQGADPARDPAVRRALDPLVERIRAVRAAESESRAERLAELAGPGAPLEVAMAAWRRLGTRPGVWWPARAVDVEADARIAEGITEGIARMTDVDRAAELRAAFTAEQRRRLIRFLDRAERSEDFDAAAVRMRALGLGTADLEPHTRYNLMLHNIKRQLAQGEISDDQAAELARRFIVDARALPGGVAFLGEAASTLAAIEHTLAADAPGGGEVNPATLGLGTTGRFVGRFEGDRLIYTPVNAPEPVFAFVRVEPAGDQAGARPFYLGTTEVSVQMFESIVRLIGQRETFAQVLPVFDPAVDARLGPRTWEWGPRGVAIRPPAEWLVSLSARAQDQYEGPPPPAPTLEHPMQYLSPTAAATVAALAGARLPTPAEWRVAWAKYAASLAAGDCNLRDGTWRRHAAHVRRQVAAGRTVQAADAGSYAPGQGSGVEADDHILWFARVGDGGRGGGGAVYHLRGNVAEWLAEPGGPDESVRYFVAGGSAIADVEAGAGDEPRPVTPGEALDGYADVGFRLAFDAPVNSGPLPLRARLERALMDAPYMRKR